MNLVSFLDQCVGWACDWIPPSKHVYSYANHVGSLSILSDPHSTWYPHRRHSCLALLLTDCIFNITLTFSLPCSLGTIYILIINEFRCYEAKIE